MGTCPSILEVVPIIFRTRIRTQNRDLLKASIVNQAEKEDRQSASTRQDAIVQGLSSKSVDGGMIREVRTPNSNTMQ